VQPDTGQKAFRLAITWSRVEMEDAEFTLPAAALELASPRLVPLGLTGNLQIKVPQLWIERGATHGGGTLRWRTAGSSLAPVSPMGDYELRFQAAGPAVRATLHTLQGPLQLEGEGAWSAGASPVFRAIARMPEKVRLRMAPFLRLIAAERTDGSFELQLK
jgi:general secretion pathway protein N